MADLHGSLIGSINRNFRGFGREIFTDTGQYVLRMDAASPETTNISNSGSVQRFPTREVEQVPLSLAEVKEAVQSNRLKLTSQQRKDLARGRPVMELVERTNAKGLTLDQRAVMLATAVSIDFDYFSHTSGYVLMHVKNLIVIGAEWVECGLFGCTRVHHQILASQNPDHLNQQLQDYPQMDPIPECTLKVMVQGEVMTVETITMEEEEVVVDIPREKLNGVKRVHRQKVIHFFPTNRQQMTHREVVIAEVVMVGDGPGQIFLTNNLTTRIKFSHPS